MEEHRFIDISKLLHCGVYALLRRGEVVYVGKSTKPFTRLYTHFKNRGKVLGQAVNGKAVVVNGKGINFDGVWFLPCMLGQLATLEMYFIRKYMPRHNTLGKEMPVMPIPDEIKELLKQMVVISDLPASRDSVSRNYMVRRL